MDAFPTDRNRRDGKYPYCRPCHAAKERKRREDPEVRARKVEASRRWAEVNRERQKYLVRRRHLRTKYGMEPEEWAELLRAQENRCALCLTEHPKGKNGWHTDHDHATGRVRGILCQSCNHVIGLIENGWSLPTLDQVAAYLEE
jgi:hypothetical protein